MPRVAMVGIGNCSAALVQALWAIGAGQQSHVDLVDGISSVPVADIELVAAFDVDARKVGWPLHTAIFADPNCTTQYWTVPPLPVSVSAGPVLDGVDGPLANVVDVDDRACRATSADVTARLREARADLVVLFLPVGAQRAAEAYASAALDAGCGLVNCTPASLGADRGWRSRFAERGLSLVGDDMKSHLGSTTVHQSLLSLLQARGIAVRSTYQLNIGGNTDFLNMRDQGRSAAKRVTKATALEGLLPVDATVGLGPSDFIPQLRDRKVGYIRIEAEGYLGMPLSIELRLEVEDSPNSAAVAIDAIRLAAAMRSDVPLDLPSALSALFKAPRPAHL